MTVSNDLVPLGMINSTRFRVTEIFGPTIQGEGAMIGVRSHFVRFAGCDYRCTWCDTPGSVLPSLYLTPGGSRQVSTFEIVETVTNMPWAPWVTLSGGNPLLYDLSDLVYKLQISGYKVAVETQGSLFKDWANSVEFMTISPKPPSSGMPSPPLDTVKKLLGHRDGCIKIVVDDQEDLTFALAWALACPDVTTYVQPCASPMDNLHTTVVKLQRLTHMVLDLPEASNLVVLPQLHKLMGVR